MIKKEKQFIIELLQKLRVSNDSIDILTISDIYVNHGDASILNYRN